MMSRMTTHQPTRPQGMSESPAFRTMIATVTACSLVWPLVPAHAEPLSVTGRGVTRDVHCNGDALQIAGFEHVLTVSGSCESITISGRSNRVDFETAGRLQVQGFQHQVHGGRASNLELSGRDSQLDMVIGAVEVASAAADQGSRAEVQIQGHKQAVTLRLEALIQLRVAGADNRIEWRSAADVPDPHVRIQGLRQTVRRAP